MMSVLLPPNSNAVPVLRSTTRYLCRVSRPTCSGTMHHTHRRQGMEHDHPDLAPNYDAKASTDLNGHDDDPYPDVSRPINKHGTRCSGEVGAVANNGNCGVGVACVLIFLVRLPALHCVLLCCASCFFLV